MFCGYFPLYSLGTWRGFLRGGIFQVVAIFKMIFLKQHRGGVRPLPHLLSSQLFALVEVTLFIQFAKSLKLDSTA